MREAIDIEELLAHNTRVSPDELAALRAMVAQLRARRPRLSECPVLPTRSGRRVSPQDPETDLRGLRLRALRERP